MVTVSGSAILLACGLYRCLYLQMNMLCVGSVLSVFMMPLAFNIIVGISLWAVSSLCVAFEFLGPWHLFQPVCVQ